MCVIVGYGVVWLAFLNNTCCFQLRRGMSVNVNNEGPIWAALLFLDL